MPDTTHPTGPPRVVLIDDETGLLTAVTALLQEYAIIVAATATDGCQALSALLSAADQHGGVDVLILDERMPHTSGCAATRLVRRFYPTLPVILYTADPKALGDEPRKAGVTTQVSKGDNPLALVGAIRSACNPSRRLALKGER